jgi:hypothetical protein
LPNDGTINHYAIVYSRGSKLELYLNGVLQTKSASTNNTPATFTGTITTNTLVTYAKMYDFSVYNYTTLSASLTDQEIVDQLYNNTFRDSGYAFSNEYSYITTKANVSRYKFGINNFEDNQNVKHIREIGLLVEGTSSNTPVSLGMNLYYNGKSSVGKTKSFDITQTAQNTWNAVTQGATLLWSQITGTWASVLGGVSSILRRKAYDCGYCDAVQMEFTHNSNDDGFKISSIQLDVEQIIR